MQAIRSVRKRRRVAAANGQVTAGLIISEISHDPIVQAGWRGAITTAGDRDCRSKRRGCLPADCALHRP